MQKQSKHDFPKEYYALLFFSFKTGFLTTASPLDYEIKSQHILTLLALDGGTPTLSSSQTLTITVLDVNDEAPVFKQHLYEASVKENQNPGEFVTRVEAVDRDSGNSKIWQLGNSC